MRRKIVEIFLRINVDKVEKIDKVETQIANKEEKVAVFMKTASTGKLLAFIASVGVALNAQAQQTIYSNDTDPAGALAFESLEFGDEVAFGSGWEENNILSGIGLEYHTSEVAGSMVIRIRQNNGPVRTDLGVFTWEPGTILYESDIIPLGITLDPNNPGVLSPGSGLLVIEGENITPVTLPNRVTVTVEFRGLNEGQEVGIITRNPPTVGRSSNDIWVSSRDDEDNVSWGLGQAGTGNFALEIVAVPEPSAILLSIFGGAAFFLLRRRK